MTSTSAPATPARAAAPATSAVCPYLLAADGGWRSATPTKAHRCTAVVPAAILAPDKQRRLCLVGEHQSCATFLAATGSSSGPDGSVIRDPSSPSRPSHARPITRTAPLVLDHGRMSVSMPMLRGERGERGVAQFVLIGLMGLAFAAIVLARLSTTQAPGGRDGGSQVIGAQATASVTTDAPDATDRPTDAPVAATAAPERTLVPTEVDPTPTAAPEATPTAAPTERPKTYKVKSGDSLSAIADEFGVTWQAIAKLNGIEDPSRLRIGQVLKLP